MPLKSIKQTEGLDSVRLEGFCEIETYFSLVGHPKSLYPFPSSLEDFRSLDVNYARDLAKQFLYGLRFGECQLLPPKGREHAVSLTALETAPADRTQWRTGA